MSLRAFLPFLVLVGSSLASPVSSQEPVPSPGTERRIEELRRRIRERVRERIDHGNRERFELRRDLRQRVRQHRLERRERLAELLDRHREGAQRERSDHERGRCGKHRKDRRDERRERLRERVRSRRSA